MALLEMQTSGRFTGRADGADARENTLNPDAVSSLDEVE
jgi:hypothetical protein